MTHAPANGGRQESAALKGWSVRSTLPQTSKSESRSRQY